MSLEQKISTTLQEVQDFFRVPGRGEELRDYALRRYISAEQQEALFAGKSEEEKQFVYKRLQENIESRVKHHNSHLRKVWHLGGVGLGIGLIANDAYHFWMGTPFKDFYAFKALMLGGKAICELPTLYSYVKDTGNVYDVVKWAGMKGLAWVFPVGGPVLDHNYLKNTIRKNAIKEGVNELLKERGLYKERPSLMERLKERVKRVTGEDVPAYQLA